MLVLTDLKSKIPLLWLNPNQQTASLAFAGLKVDQDDMREAADRLDLFADLLRRVLPELDDTGGIIESPLLTASVLQRALVKEGMSFGALYIKADHDLPVTGSVKARGGIYEVLTIAERIAEREGLMSDDETPSCLSSEKARQHFSLYTISVGSTGNLGLSIGIIARALGFKAEVHMSSDAKAWKKQLLRDRGVKVVEYRGDYAAAVSAARNHARGDGSVYFIDDENSLALFLGYSVAAFRLQKQFDRAGITVDENHPLFVYIPCGVGGAPGGITYGLKRLWGDNVHCFFAEPVSSPCMLMRLAFNNDLYRSVYDIELDNKTDADGLAVATASELAATLIESLVSGIFTVTDDELYRSLYLLEQTESLKVEPSATAGMGGPKWLLQSAVGRSYLDRNELSDKLQQSTHLIWTTGGALMPPADYLGFWKKGRATL